MSNINKKALNFQANAVMEDGVIFDGFIWDDFADGFDTVLFFYPLDFTFVCPSELIALANRAEKFRNLNTKVAVVSVDSVYSHSAWRKQGYDEGGLGGSYPFCMISDLNRQISDYYDVLHEDGVSLRATLIIDKEGYVRVQMVNDLPIGRNVDEILRLIEAMQFNREHGDVCPAMWQKGKKAMKATYEGVRAYIAESYQEL